MIKNTLKEIKFSIIQTLFLLILMFCVHDARAQLLKQQFTVSSGINVSLNFNSKKIFHKAFPGIRAFIGMNYNAELNFIGQSKGLFNFGTSLGIYNKSLGNSLNLGFQDNQIDWTTNITLGTGWGDTLYYKQLQSINNLPFYNIKHRYKYATMVGVNFIMNNYKRNQTNGTFSFTADNFSLTYYNDGGPFFSWLGLGDSFDRYWTGGLMLYLHATRDTFQNPFNRVECTFDQFTGYKRGLYELQGILGVDLQDYDIYDSSIDSIYAFSLNEKKALLSASGNTRYDFNASQYRVMYRFDEFVGGGFGMIGSLRSTKKERYYALQDIIHILTKAPIHPNRNLTRLQLLFEYNQNLLNP
ncbi:MAG: hypothetical protein IPN79_08245 [Saprospiraceae bacterium]|nr:hypothetical protein [Saprospiraceae bacterium]